MSFIQSKIKLLRNNHFLKDVAVLSSGTAAAQLIPFLFLPLLSRLYQPELYGILVSMVLLLPSRSKSRVFATIMPLWWRIAMMKQAVLLCLA